MMSIEGNKISLFTTTSKGVLPNLIGAIAGGSIPLIRSEDIDNEEKCAEFIKMAKLLQTKCGWEKKTLRIACMHLNNIREEWAFIKEQHRCLLEENKRNPSLIIAHISLPTERIYFKVTPRFTSAFIQNKLIDLLRQFNSEATCMYYTWLCQEVEGVLKQFKPEAGEEYSLQASLEDFCHEVRSGFLKMYLNEISDSVIAQGKLDISKDHDRMLELEKNVVMGRLQLIPIMQYQSTLLKKILDVISKIPKLTPELARLKMMINIAYLLMGHQFGLPDSPKLSWGQRIMLLQLIDQHLNVVSALNSKLGLGRTSFVFAIRLALASISQDYPDKEVLDLILNWQNSRESTLGKEFRRRVWVNFEALHVPLRTLPVREGVLNVEFLQFLPEKAIVERNGKTKEVTFLVYDEEKKAPINFTSLGERLLGV